MSRKRKSEGKARARTRRPSIWNRRYTGFWAGRWQDVESGPEWSVWNVWK